jgi:hypothetical protein
MPRPSATTPLYSHPLPEIELWLSEKGGQQIAEAPHCWLVTHPDWNAELCLDTDQLTVRYFGFGQGDREVMRAFKYSLSRQDIEAAVFSGP